MHRLLDVVDEVVALFERRGHAPCAGEAVTQLAHALQCAWLAKQDHAGAALVIAALLHDVGHLFDDGDEELPASRGGGPHEHAGALWLSRFFDQDVTEPVRLHVEAKRYLCATDPHYVASLTAASRHSLVLQGGPLRLTELAGFAESPFAREAVRLRRWDDRAKMPGLDVPGLRHYDVHLRIAARLGPGPTR